MALLAPGPSPTKLRMSSENAMQCLIHQSPSTLELSSQKHISQKPRTKVCPRTSRQQFAFYIGCTDLSYYGPVLFEYLGGKVEKLKIREQKKKWSSKIQVTTDFDFMNQRDQQSTESSPEAELTR